MNRITVFAAVFAVALTVSVSAANAQCSSCGQSSPAFSQSYAAPVAYAAPQQISYAAPQFAAPQFAAPQFAAPQQVSFAAPQPTFAAPVQSACCGGSQGISQTFAARPILARPFAAQPIQSADCGCGAPVAYSAPVAFAAPISTDCGCNPCDVCAPRTRVVRQRPARVRTLRNRNCGCDTCCY